MPPVFNGCTGRLSREDEASASALYWSVAQQNQPLISPDATRASLKQAIRLNPWVAEPYLLLAQLHLTFDEFDQAVDVAASGVQLASIWGNTWDKRIGWDAWMAWGRILLQSAQKKSWPKDINRLNNLALG